MLCISCLRANSQLLCDSTSFEAHLDISGSAVVSLTDASPTIRQCRFIGNTYTRSAVSVKESSGPSFIGCAFESNFGFSSGPSSALLIDGYGNTTLTNCSFLDNRSPGGAAVIAGDIRRE